MKVQSRLLVIAALATSIGLAGCDSGPSSAPTSEAPQAPSAPMTGAATAATPEPARDFAATQELKKVHFALDQTRIRSTDAKILDDNARWLKSRGDVEILVGVRGRAEDRVNRGRLGPKGLHGWAANHSPDRLTHPLVRDGELRDSAYYPITDDEWPAVRANLERRLAAALEGAVQTGD